MNQKNLNALIERIESCSHVHSNARPFNRRSFNMNDSSFPCGSPSCIAGHCNDLLQIQIDNNERDELKISEGWSHDPIKQFLECDDKRAYDLYNGHYSLNQLNDITVQETAAHLKTFRRK